MLITNSLLSHSTRAFSRVDFGIIHPGCGFVGMIPRFGLFTCDIHLLCKIYIEITRGPIEQLLEWGWNGLWRPEPAPRCCFFFFFFLNR